MKEIHYASGNHYVGEVKDGKRHGKGTFYFANGFKYEGEFKEGVIDGNGTFYYEDGNVYTGEFKSNVRQGYGTMQYSNGDKYQGSWLDGKKSGTGTYTYLGGDVYEGDFSLGKQNGKGTLKKVNGYTYSGEFVEGKADGEGMCTIEDGTTFVGKFALDKIVSGKITYMDGTIVEGEFNGQNKSGKGTITYPNGSYYIGEFNNQLKHGEGKLFYSSGAIESGKWENDVLVERMPISSITTEKEVIDLSSDLNSHTLLENFVAPEDDMDVVDVSDAPIEDVNMANEIDAEEENFIGLSNETEDDILEGIIIRNKTKNKNRSIAEKETSNEIFDETQEKITVEHSEIDSEISDAENSIINSIITEEINATNKKQSFDKESALITTEGEVKSKETITEPKSEEFSDGENLTSQEHSKKTKTIENQQTLEDVEILRTNSLEQEEPVDAYDIYTDIYAEDEWAKKDVMSYNFDQPSQKTETKKETKTSIKKENIKEDKTNQNTTHSTQNKSILKTEIEDEMFVSENPSDIYEKAKENKKDPELEYFLYYLSATNGHEKAIKKLKADRKYAKLYYAKYLAKVSNNHKKIFNAYVNASNYKNVSAEYFVATQCVLGIGTKQSLKQALKWYKKILKNKDVNAMKYKQVAENNINLIKAYLSNKNKNAILDLNSLTIKIEDTEKLKSKSEEIIIIER